LSGWDDWADSLAAICRNFVRPPGVYGMTTDDELCFLENYARYSYTGEGKIVDLGCWLGATTLCLARGLADSPHRPGAPPIEAFDRFVWEEWMTPIAAALGVPRQYAPGDDFAKDVRDLLRSYDSLVRICQENLLWRAAFPSPLEFLFIDAMKSWPLADAIAHAFLPSLITNRSLVVQQDFGYHAPIVATNHLLMWYLRDHFERVYCIPRSCGVVFFHTKAISGRDLPKVAQGQFSVETIDQAFDHSLRIATPEMRHPVLLCKLLFLVELGEEQAAGAAAERLAAEGASFSGQAVVDAQETINRRLAAGGHDRSTTRAWHRIAELVASRLVP
jgi:hypothetical protein